MLKFFEQFDKSLLYIKYNDEIVLYISSQDVVFSQYFEGALNDLKEENPTIYNEICSKIRAAI